jgi:hypothetical protein
LEEQRGTEEYRVLENGERTTRNDLLERKNSNCKTWCLGKIEQQMQDIVSWKEITANARHGVLERKNSNCKTWYLG